MNAELASATPRPSSPPEQRKYQLLARLDRGGMADVYLALARGPLDFKKLLVVKCLRPVSGQEALCHSMFIDEARLAARLNHPNVVQTYEISETEGRPLIAMEYLEGQSLARLRKAAKTIDPRRATRILCDALAGLHHAHELRDFDGTPFNLVHRDLSPQNVFVTYDGVVKLLDFGVARAELPARARTKVGVLKGKFSYMAPEQTTGEPIDRRTDIFTAGIVLWELLACRRMFGGTAVQKLKSLIHDPIPRLSSVRPDVDPELERIVHKALEKDPAGRYATAEAMRDELEHFLSKSGPPVRAEDIARLMLAHFAIERQELRNEIQELIAVESSAVGSVPALKSAPLRDLPSVPPSSLAPVMQPEPPLPAVSDEGHGPALFAPARRRAIVAGAGVAALLVGLVAVIVGTSRPAPVAGVAAAPVLVAAARAPSPPAAPAEPLPPVAPLPAIEGAASAAAAPTEGSSPRVRRASVPSRSTPVRAAAPSNLEVAPPEATASARARVRLVEDKPRLPILD